MSTAVDTVTQDLENLRDNRTESNSRIRHGQLCSRCETMLWNENHIKFKELQVHKKKKCDICFEIYLSDLPDYEGELTKIAQKIRSHTKRTLDLILGKIKYKEVPLKELERYAMFAINSIVNIEKTCKIFDDNKTDTMKFNEILVSTDLIIIEVVRHIKKFAGQDDDFVYHEDNELWDTSDTSDVSSVDNSNDNLIFSYSYMLKNNSYKLNQDYKENYILEIKDQLGIGIKQETIKKLDSESKQRN